MVTGRVNATAQYLRLGYALSVLGCIGLAACSAVLGIDSRTLDPELAEGGLPEAGRDSATTDAPADTTSDVSSDTRPDTASDAPPSDSSSADTSSVDAAAPLVLAMGLNHPFSLTADNNNAYWTEYGSGQGTADGVVRSCPVAGCGGGPTTIAAALVNPRGIAVDDANVYFGTATYGGTMGGIKSCPLAGCNGALPTTLAGAAIPEGIALDQTYVYWVDNDDNSVHRVLKAGGPDTVLVSAATSPLVQGAACVVDGTNVYVSDFNQDVFRLPLAGGSIVQMVTGQLGGNCALALDQTYVYYVSGMQVLRMAKTATSGGSPIASGIQQAVDLKIDPANPEIYWADYGSGLVNDGTIGKVGTSGSAQTLLGSSLAPPEGVAISGNFLVWLSNGTAASDGGGAADMTGVLTRQPK